MPCAPGAVSAVIAIAQKLLADAAIQSDPSKRDGAPQIALSPRFFALTPVLRVHRSESSPPLAKPPPPTDEATDALFKQWEEQETATSLGDLKPTDYVAFCFFWLLFGVVFLQFYTRYVLNDALGWTEEIARYLLIAVCFSGAVMAMRKGTHIAVEALLIYLPARARHVVHILIDATVAAFSALMAWSAVRLSLRTTQYMVSIDVPKSVLYWGVALAFAGITLHATLRLIRRLRGEAVAESTLILD